VVEALLDCVEECLDCAVICTACPGDLQYLLPHATFRFPRTRAITVDFRLISAVVEFCADACLVCVEQCERHAARDECCQSCTDACRRCRIACERLAALIR
jgi:hypothetical protein